jgi:hypothetical protein
MVHTYETVPGQDTEQATDDQTVASPQEEQEFILTEEEEKQLLAELPPEEVLAIDEELDRLYNGRIVGPSAAVRGNDGVFSNMSAKPNQGKTFEEIEPPSYHDVIVDPSPDYHINCVDETGEVLIEGICRVNQGFPVGDYFIFFINTFISMTFDVLGFFLTTLMATTHAARFGSQNGLGLTLMRYVAIN